MIKYQELDDDLKSAFHALGLCAGSGASLEAIAWMLEFEPDAARRLLMDLNERSLASFNGERAALNPLIYSFAGLRARQEASLLRDIGATQSSVEEMGDALDSYDQALTIYKQIDDKVGQANTLKLIGEV